tara:strand:+ start:3203 stop:3367 length:165 start_codon:yes stop_codon:yes gene_type:complete
MSDIKTITETIASGSYSVEEKFLKNNEIEEVLTIKLLKTKIDELVAEVNILKNQ